MGSLAVFADGSSEFAIDSGSTLVDFFSELPSLVLMLANGLGIQTSLDLTASLDN